MVTYIAIVIAAAIGTAIALAIAGNGRTTIVVGVVGLFVFPKSLVTIVTSDDITDFVAPEIGITFAGLAVGIGTLLVLTSGQRFELPFAFIVFIGGLAFSTNFLWGGTTGQWAGIATMLVAILAWPIGAQVRRLASTSVNSERLLARLVAAVLIFEGGVSAVQAAGVALPTWLTSVSQRSDYLDSGRVVGTFGHPANFGKVVFFLLVIALITTYSKDALARKWALVSVALGVVITALTVSRANALAVVILLALWLVFAEHRASRRLRALLAVVLAAVGVVAWGAFSDRFAGDPDGGLRPALLEAGLAQLERNPWTGVGINSYIQQVGQYDSATASGYPVHNALVLWAVCLGLPLAILFFFPHAKIVMTAFRRWRQDPVARVAVFATPGMLIMMWTGWGVFSAAVVTPWLFMAGFVAATVVGVSRLSIDDAEFRESSQSRATLR